MTPFSIPIRIVNCKEKALQIAWLRYTRIANLQGRLSRFSFWEARLGCFSLSKGTFPAIS
jgi:hypothetical protein